MVSLSLGKHPALTDKRVRSGAGFGFNLEAALTERVNLLRTSGPYVPFKVYNIPSSRLRCSAND